MELDSIDRKILKELQDDACLSNVELASRINLSPSPCLARVKAMDRAGIIRRRVTLLDPAALGLNLNVFIHVSLENQRREGLDEFERAVSALTSVMECYLMTGDADYLLRVLVRDTQALERLIVDELTKIPNVRNKAGDVLDGDLSNMKRAIDFAVGLPALIRSAPSIEAVDQGRVPPEARSTPGVAPTVVSPGLQIGDWLTCRRTAGHVVCRTWRMREKQPALLRTHVQRPKGLAHGKFAARPRLQIGERKRNTAFGGIAVTAQARQRHVDARIHVAIGIRYVLTNCLNAMSGRAHQKVRGGIDEVEGKLTERLAPLQVCCHVLRDEGMMRPDVHSRDKARPLPIKKRAHEKDPVANRRTLPGLYEHVVDGQYVTRHLVTEFLAESHEHLFQRVEIFVERAARNFRLADHVVDNGLRAGALRIDPHGSVEELCSHQKPLFFSDFRTMIDHRIPHHPTCRTEKTNLTMTFCQSDKTILVGNPGA